MNKNPISVLQEFLQKNCYPLPRYDIIATSSVNFTYRVMCEIRSHRFSATGQSKNKQTAKFNAAENLIIQLKSKNFNIFYEPENIESPENNSHSSTLNGVNFIGKLQEQCLKHRYVMPCYSEGVYSQGHTDFKMTCTVGTYCVEGTSNGKKKQAKYACAKKMIEDLENMSETQKLQYNIRDNSVPCVTKSSKDEMNTNTCVSKELSIDSPEKTSHVIKKALTLFPKLSKAYTLSGDSAKIKLSTYHTHFKSSLDNSQLAKFFEFYQTLNLHQIQNDISKLSSALHEICTILKINKQESVVKTVDDANYGVVITLTTNPEFSDVAVADNFLEARLNVHYRMIRTIFYLLI
ncbi:GSCOCG00001056001-RA-CDS [Cotesia congregata]|uniref:DRBM domain-containing protein n=1 Tax=Cotesia congregata TaxID=51543 RepID=A0A8J2MN10_COTCN|nr:GSCOCG00001056001-RA-CDS [Cotesia congregata]CAG5096049.1 Protein of unknown function [Cotesia congregata]